MSLICRGKFLNVKNASVDILIKNKEVKSLIQSLGLQHGVDYCEDENFKKLRYNSRQENWRRDERSTQKIHAS